MNEEVCPVGTTKLLESYRDALDHIKRICHMSHQMSKRTYWIAQRAASALEGDEKWREFDYPKNRTNEKLNLRKRYKRLRELAIEWGESGEMCGPDDLERILEEAGL